jgi:hypothetical protein
MKIIATSQSRSRNQERNQERSLDKSQSRSRYLDLDCDVETKSKNLDRDFLIVETNFLKLSRFSRPSRLILFWRQDHVETNRDPQGYFFEKGTASVKTVFFL